MTLVDSRDKLYDVSTDYLASRATTEMRKVFTTVMGEINK